VLNLIPVPPLDGSKVLFAFLDRRTEYQIRRSSSSTASSS
jgi:Zn-dependent protease